MKNWFIRIGFLAVAVVVALTGIITFYATFNSRGAIALASKSITVDNNEVRVDIYGRNTGDRDAHPVFAVCELVNKCINYKKLHKQEEVTIDYAIYRMEVDTACYYKPSSRKYGKTTTLKKNYTDDCERVAYSFVKAAKYGIKVRLLYHRDAELVDDNSVLEWFNSFMDDSCFFDKTKRVSDFLEVRKAQWNLSETMSNQMHSKQLLVSDYVDYDGKEYHNAINSMTSNVDTYETSYRPISKKDWTHSGYTISNHDKIFEANNRYFEITWKCYENRYTFVEEVLNAHAENALNYQDEHFECYFLPMPQNYTDAYDEEYNPYAKYVEKLNETKGQIKCYMNMYSLDANVMTNKICKRLHSAFTTNTTETNDCGFIIKKTLKPGEQEYQWLKEIGFLSVGPKTHSKDTMFYFGDTDEHVVITGSANLGYSGWCSKSNYAIVFKEKGDSHEIYDAFYKIYKGANVR